MGLLASARIFALELTAPKSMWIDIKRKKFLDKISIFCYTQNVVTNEMAWKYVNIVSINDNIIIAK